MDAWILRLRNYRPLIGGGNKVAVLHITSEGKETELEIEDLDVSNHLSHVAEDQIQRGRVRLILDLSSVNRMDSHLLGEMVTALVRTRNSGGELVLANPDSKMSLILDTPNVGFILPSIPS